MLRWIALKQNKTTTTTTTTKTKTCHAVVQSRAVSVHMNLCDLWCREIKTSVSLNIPQ